ncbi:hypothetical protein JN11_01416 [Mucilaginibacter frigoritolerans]|uniref:Uncharacterized protein n=1 Tax=Mucilaginibacter frigoritolerans TaxID=652788 RepID=A0A562U9C8_9SPHI|nr:hypothetical protein [Mucilaginibacter frigoritolerans]TWJ02443.1 hypothetical protein JN11_01416 [Mucilaginibacter frigoritolerans]
MEIMNYISKNLPILIVVIGTIAALIANAYKSSKDASQSDNIERLGNETQKLSALNRDISIKIQQITTANKQTSDENLALNQKSKELIIEVQKLTIETQKLIAKVDERTAYEAAENLQSGELHLDFSQAFTDKISFRIGGNTFSNPLKNFKMGAKIFQFADKDPISIGFDHSKILISMKVFDLKGNLIAEIENNFWRPNRNFTGKFNYDDHGFEVMDNEGNIAVSIDITGTNQLDIQGVFPIKEQKIIIFAGQQMNILAFKNPDIEAQVQARHHISYDDYLNQILHDLRIRQIFEYTGKNWLHKRRPID